MFPSKTRLSAGAAMIVFGIVGLGTLSACLTVLLEPFYGLALSLAVVGGILFAIACLCLVIALRPDNSTEDEIHRLQSLMAEALADLPLDAINILVSKHPTTCLTLAAVTGYTLSKDPEAAIRNLRKAVAGLSQ